MRKIGNNVDSLHRVRERLGIWIFSVSLSSSDHTVLMKSLSISNIYKSVAQAPRSERKTIHALAVFTIPVAEAQHSELYLYVLHILLWPTGKDSISIFFKFYFFASYRLALNCYISLYCTDTSRKNIVRLVLCKCTLRTGIKRLCTYIGNDPTSLVTKPWDVTGVCDVEKAVVVPVIWWHARVTKICVKVLRVTTHGKENHNRKRLRFVNVYIIYNNNM